MQEGVTRLWRGTNASLTLAIPSVSLYLEIHLSFIFHWLFKYEARCYVQLHLQLSCFVIVLIKCFFCLLQVGIYLPLYDIFRNCMEEYTLRNVPMATPYVPLVAGSLARSISCVTCYPVELARTRMQVNLIIYLMLMETLHDFL